MRFHQRSHFRPTLSDWKTHSVPVGRLVSDLDVLLEGSDDLVDFLVHAEAGGASLELLELGSQLLGLVGLVKGFDLRNDLSVPVGGLDLLHILIDALELTLDDSDSVVSKSVAVLVKVDLGLEVLLKVLDLSVELLALGRDLESLANLAESGNLRSALNGLELLHKEILLNLGNIGKFFFDVSDLLVDGGSTLGSGNRDLEKRRLAHHLVSRDGTNEGGNSNEFHL